MNASFGSKGELVPPERFLALCQPLIVSKTISYPCNTSLPLVYRKFESSKVDVNILVNH
jgi:hypothetical protein